MVKRLDMPEGIVSEGGDYVSFEDYDVIRQELDSLKGDFKACIIGIESISTDLQKYVSFLKKCLPSKQAGKEML